MNSFVQVIDALGGPIPFGKAIKVPTSHARTMKARNSVPPAYWSDVVAEAQRLGVHRITYETLAKCVGRRLQRRHGSARVAA